MEAAFDGGTRGRVTLLDDAEAQTAPTRPSPVPARAPPFSVDAGVSESSLGPGHTTLLGTFASSTRTPSGINHATTDARRYELEANVAKDRERLVVPADPVEAGRLAARYHNPGLGHVVVSKASGATIFDFGECKSAVATRKNDDGSVSFRTIDLGAGGFELVVAGQTLVLRDSQHEYVFTPQTSSTSSSGLHGRECRAARRTRLATSARSPRIRRTSASWPSGGTDGILCRVQELAGRKNLVASHFPDRSDGWFSI